MAGAVGIAPTWSLAWRAAQHNPLLLLLAVLALGGSAEGAVWLLQIAGDALLAVPRDYFTMSGAYFILDLTITLLLRSIFTMFALGMVAKANVVFSAKGENEHGRQIARCLARAVMAWVAVDLVTGLVATPLTFVDEFYYDLSTAQQVLVSLGGALLFGFLRAGLASLVFAGLPDRVRLRYQPNIASGRRHLLVCYLILFSTTGVVSAVASLLWNSPFAVARIVYLNTSLDGLLVILLSFATAARFEGVSPAEQRVFD